MNPGQPSKAMQDLAKELRHRKAKKRREAVMLRGVPAAESLRMGFSMIRFARRLRDRHA